MKNVIAVLLLAVTSSAYGAQNSELLKRTAVCVKALLQKGHHLDSIVEVSPGELQSVPPKQCILVVTERKPNTECSDNPFVGPDMNKGSVACLSPATGEVDYIGYFESQCSPQLRGESLLKSQLGRVRVSL